MVKIIVELDHKLFHFEVYNAFPCHRKINKIIGQKNHIRWDGLNYSANKFKAITEMGI